MICAGADFDNYDKDSVQYDACNSSGTSPGNVYTA